MEDTQEGEQQGRQDRPHDPGQDAGHRQDGTSRPGNTGHAGCRRSTELWGTPGQRRRSLHRGLFRAVLRLSVGGLSAGKQVSEPDDEPRRGLSTRRCAAENGQAGTGQRQGGCQQEPGQERISPHRRVRLEQHTATVNTQQGQRDPGRPGPREHPPVTPLGLDHTHHGPDEAEDRGDPDGDDSQHAECCHAPGTSPGDDDPHIGGEQQVPVPGAPAAANDKSVPHHRGDQCHLAGQRGQAQYYEAGSRHPARLDGAPGRSALTPPPLTPLGHHPGQQPQRHREGPGIHMHPRQSIAVPLELLDHA